MGHSCSTSTGLVIPSPTALLASFPIFDLSLRYIQNHEQFTGHLCSSALSVLLFSGEILCQVILPQKLRAGRLFSPLDTQTVGYTAMCSRFAALLVWRPVASALLHNASIDTWFTFLPSSISTCQPCFHLEIFFQTFSSHMKALSSQIYLIVPLAVGPEDRELSALAMKTGSQKTLRGLYDCTTNIQTCPLRARFHGSQVQYRQ